MAEHTIDVTSDIELTDAEKMLVLRMRGDLPPEPHPHQEHIDKRVYMEREACAKFDEAVAEADRVRDEAIQEARDKVQVDLVRIREQHAKDILGLAEE